MNERKTVTSEAVEAAANAVWENVEVIQTREYAAEIARLALEAAAPHMLADAWDEGFSAGEDVGNWHAAPVTKQPSLTNPYRSQG